MNYEAKLISTERYGMDKRKVGDIVFVHIFEDGQVLFYSPYSQKEKKPVFDIILNNIDEAKLYATCIRKTNFDVKAAWDKTMSDRYW